MHSKLNCIQPKNSERPLLTSTGRCVTPHTVALTYDDNPTEEIYDLLALLKRYNATATFFHNGPNHINKWKLDTYISDIYAAGHQIGLHTSVHVMNRNSC